MSQSTCPHCGKSIRPGSKFCGHCGNTISATPAPQPQPAVSAQCPHCNSPVRPAAKFCSHCGRSIEGKSEAPVATPVPPQPTPAVQPAATTERAAPRPAAQFDEQATAQTKPEAIPPKPTPVAVPPPDVVPPPQRRYRLLPWLLAAILIVVCMGSAGGLFYYYDPFGLFAKPTVTTTATTTASATWTATLSQPTETSESIAATATLEPTFTPPLTATDTELPPTQEGQPSTETPDSTTQPVDSQTDNVLLDEQFDNQVTDNWEPWGRADDRPFKEEEVFDNSVNLNAENPSGGGLTSKDVFNFVPGLEIEFSAKLNKIFTAYQLVFNLDTPEKRRAEGDNDKGLLQLDIYRDKVIVVTSVPDVLCEQPLSGLDTHTYLFRILEANGISLFVDNNPEPLCKNLDLGEAAASGRITFRGLGFVSSVKVTAP